MLHVFLGNDTITVRQAATAFVTSKAADPQSVTRVDSDTYAVGIFNDLAGATSLFGGETLYLIDTPSLNKEFFAEVLESLPQLAESANTFVIIEEAMLAPEKKKFAKYAESIEEFKKPAAERFNAFAMADSLAKKDKRLLWVDLMKAKQQGLSAEEIIGTLWWQLKCMELAKRTGSASEAGMKDFPYNKAKRALCNFKDGEVEALSDRLLSVYHDGHGGIVDIDLALEKWVLTI